MSLSEKSLLAELVVYLNEIDIFKKCDGKTLKYCSNYMKSTGMSIEEIGRMCYFLQNHGGYCDCEVLMNVVPYVFPSEEEYKEYIDKAAKKIRKKRAGQE